MKPILAFFLLSALALAETPGTWTGTITDSMCLGNHSMMNIPGDDNCVRQCVKSGTYKYVLFDGKKAFRLSDQKLPAQFAAQKVTVKGVLYEKTGVIKVEKIQPVK
jgi:hypothetical protein